MSTIDRDRLAALAAVNNCRKGRFRNLEPIPTRRLSDLLRWQLGSGMRFPPGRRYALLRPDERALAQPPLAPQLTWLGHASFLFQFRGVNVLTDPVLSQ